VQNWSLSSSIQYILLNCDSFWQITFSRYTFFKLFLWTSDRVLVIGEGFLGELDRVLYLVEGFLGELKLVLELIEGFLQELKLVLEIVEFFCLLVQQPCGEQRGGANFVDFDFERD
jgi:hypothetical protein